MKQNNTWFVNKDFPAATSEPTICSITIRRAHAKVSLIRQGTKEGREVRSGRELMKRGRAEKEGRSEVEEKYYNSAGTAHIFFVQQPSFFVSILF